MLGISGADVQNLKIVSREGAKPRRGELSKWTVPARANANERHELHEMGEIG
jgi:hypothetical protein